MAKKFHATLYLYLCRDVHPCYMVPRCPLPRCQVSRFQSPHRHKSYDFTRHRVTAVFPAAVITRVCWRPLIEGRSISSALLQHHTAVMMQRRHLTCLILGATSVVNRLTDTCSIYNQSLIRLAIPLTLPALADRTDISKEPSAASATSSRQQIGSDQTIQ